VIIIQNMVAQREMLMRLTLRLKSYKRITRNSQRSVQEHSVSE